MEEKEKIIKLICEIDKVYDLYMCDCGCCLDVIKNFLDELNNIFDDTLNISLLKYIKGLDTRVFTDKYFCCSKFNNNNFNMIRDFINDPNTNGKKIEIPYNLLLKYIEKEVDFLHDYKSTLQELAQTVKKSIIYEVVDEEGPAHNKKFTSIVKVDGIIMGRGTAGSKKASEQEAAKDALSKRAGIK